MLRGDPAARAGEIPVPTEMEAEQGAIEQPAKLLRIG